MANWMLLFHVLAALWVTGGVFGSIVARAQARRASGAAEAVGALRIAARLHKVYTLPGLAVAGFTGIALVGHLRYSFSLLWVYLSTILWVLMLAAAFFWLSPGLKRAVAAAEEALAADPAAPAAAPGRAVAVLGDLLALVVVVLVALMILKPA